MTLVMASDNRAALVPARSLETERICTTFLHLALVVLQFILFYQIVLSTFLSWLHLSFNNSWLQLMISLAMQTSSATPFAFYVKLFFLLGAASWLFFRAYLVLKKPLSELALLLGFDIPPVPLIDLASIKSDGCVIHWSLPPSALDKQSKERKGSLKYEIHLNGSVIETLPSSESAVTITGLLPSSSYVVRVGFVNSVDFGSRSEPIRFRTKSAASGDAFVRQSAAAVADAGQESDNGGDGQGNVGVQPVPRVIAFRGLKDVSAPATLAPELLALSRDNSTGAAGRRSTIGGRKMSSAVATTTVSDRLENSIEDSEQEESIVQLTQRLDEIRRETEEAEKSLRDDEEEDLRLKAELIEERDRLKAEVQERDKASKTLRKDVSVMERQNTIAQNERSKQERILQSKKAERQKLKDDALKWEVETLQIRKDMEKLKEEKIRYLADVKKEKEELAKQQAAEALQIRGLEDQVKARNQEIKQLESEMRENALNGQDSEPNLVQQLQQDAEAKRIWDITHNSLMREYSVAVQKEEQAKQFYEEQVKYLQDFRARRRQEDLRQYASPPSTQERLPRRTDSNRSRHAANGQGSATESPRPTMFSPMSTSSFASGVTATSSVFAPAGSFMNFQSGIPPALSLEETNMSEEERERLTGGALMSPTAGADLLPADLFVDGDTKAQYFSPLPGLGPAPDEIPGLGEIPAQTSFQDSTAAGPVSPISETSRSHSVFASPQASQQNLHIGSPEHVMDADRRSIRSTRSNRATSSSNAGSRFSGMWGGLKSRSKTVSQFEEGPALGRLQSHSMPRNDQGLPGIDSSSRKRNSSVSGSVFNGPGNENLLLDSQSEMVIPSTRRRPFGFFSKDKSGWPSSFDPQHSRSESPRPGSTHSLSSEFPRPSTDSTRWMHDPWPMADGSGANRSSPLGFGAAWNPSAAQSSSRLFGPSRMPSRRPSAQHGIHGPPEQSILEGEDDFEDVLAPPGDQEAQLAPIGTKPAKKADKGKQAETAASSAAVDATKLNPAAKDFKSFFSSMKLRDKDKGKESATSSVLNTPQPDNGEFDYSPPASRRSKDTRDSNRLSLTTTIESTALESGRESPILTRIETNAASDAAAPSPLTGSATGSSLGKESFMQKLTRKSSSGKFTLPTFSSKRASKQDLPGATTPGVHSATTPGNSGFFPAEEKDEDDAMSASVSSVGGGRESREVSRSGAGGSGRNWSSVLKLSKKKGGEAPSVSGMSLTSAASGTTEEDGEGPSGEREA